MTFYFRTIQIGTPKQPGEGLRIGTVRYLPRGMPKEEYSKHNLFDVWLPTLAPSKELLEAYRNGLSLKRTLHRYRREMQRTEARQTIQLVAELAKNTPISIACYCGNEGKCHRSVLSQLVREAAGEDPVPPNAKSCVYTILHPKTLAAIEKDGGVGHISENKPWTGAVDLLLEAQANAEALPIVLADATDCSRLIYSGRVSNIWVNGHTTHCEIFGLKQLKGRHSPQEMTLLSTGRKIAAGFIRPYALVRTPKFVR